MKPILAALCALLIAAPALADRLAVVNKGGDTVALVDPDSLAIQGVVEVGANPHEAIATADGSRLFVVDYGGARGDTISVVDPAAGERIAAWSLGPHRGPHGLALSSDESRLWVTTEGTGTVVELDAATGAILDSWQTGQQVSHMVAALPDDSKLYVANIGSGSVSVIDRAANVVTTVATGAGAEGIDVSPDGLFVWVTNREANRISVIDPRTDAVVADFSSEGDVPIRAAFTPDGAEVWVSNYRSDSVAVFDAVTRQPVATIAVEAAPIGLLVSPDGARIYVANTADDRVTVIDARARWVIGAFEPGDEPDGLAWIRSGAAAAE